MSKELVFFVTFGILLLSAIFIPYVQAEFGNEITTINVDEFGNQINQVGVTDVGDEGGISYKTFLKALGIIFAWSFGVIPWYIDLVIYLPLRILMYYLLVDLIWIG